MNWIISLYLKDIWSSSTSKTWGERTTTLPVWKKSDRLRDSCSDYCIRMWHNANSAHTRNHLKIWPFWVVRSVHIWWVSYPAAHGKVHGFDPQGSSKCLETIKKLLPSQWLPHQKEIMNISFSVNCCQRFYYINAGRYHNNTNSFLCVLGRKTISNVPYNGRNQRTWILHEAWTFEQIQKSCLQRRVNSFRSQAYFGWGNIEAWEIWVERAYRILLNSWNILSLKIYSVVSFFHTLP